MHKAFINSSLLSGISLHASNGSFAIGQTTSAIEIEGLRFHFSPRAFVQNHPEQSLKIYQALQMLSKKSYRILDLYCGIGISTLLLAAEGKKVIGVEGSREAVALAKSNAALNALTSTLFIRADVKKVVKKLMEEHHPDLIIVNPPRKGLDPKVVADLIDGSAQEILYISCMPPTLARDLRLLCSEKYSIHLCQPFDMFPQTGHVETLVHLKRK